MLRGVSRSAALSLGLLATACQTLPDVQAGVCGNHVVDPGEDCDGVIAGDKGTNITCGLPGTATACRFDCTADAAVCPSRYVCGTDGICRQPSGQFEVLTSLPASASFVTMGDFDGDGRSDLVSLDYDSGQIEVHFFESDGVVTRTASTPSDGVFPVVAKLDASKPYPGTDLAYALLGGLGVLRGQADRSFASTAYPTFQVPNWDADAAVVVTDVIPPAPIDPMMPLSGMSTWKWIGDEMLVLHGSGVYCPTAGPDYTTKPVLKLPVSGPWLQSVPVGNLDEDPANSPCNELVLPDAGGAQVFVVTPCLRPKPGADLTWNMNAAGDDLQTKYPPIHLPAGAKPTRALIAHLNPTVPSQSSAGRDNHLDLLIEAEVNNQTHVFVAYGFGDGRFRSTPPAPGDTNDDQAVLYPAADAWGQLPLAVVDFNGDGVPDFVEPFGVLQSVPFSSPPEWVIAALPLEGSPSWSNAVVVDYNGDGLLDVVAGGDGHLGVQLFTNTGGGEFNTDFVPTEQPASAFALGDFDGDLNVDLAFREAGGGAHAGLYVMFGRHGELPLAPALLAELDGIDQLVVGDNLGKHLPQNAMSDILALTRTKGKDVRAAAFVARADRALQAPFFFFDDNSSSFYPPVLVGAVAGAFHASAAPDPEGLADIAALVLDADSTGNATAPALHLLRAGDGAQFAAHGKTPVMMQSPQWASAVLATVDIEGDGVDEVAVLLPDKPPAGMTAGQSSQLLVYSLDAKNGATSFGGTPVTIPLKVGLYDRAADPSQSGLRNPPACVARVDGDAYPDLVTLGVPEGGGALQVVVLWGTGKKDAPFEATPTAVALPAAARGFTCVDLHGDGYADILAVTSDAAYSIGGKRNTAADPPTRTLESSGLVDPRDPSGMRALHGGVSVTTGNIDDDNIPDLVISDAKSAQVYLGKAVIP